MCRKLAIAFSLIFLFLCVLGFSSLHVINSIGGQLDTAVNQDSRATVLLGKVEVDLRDMKEQSWSTQIANAFSHVVGIRQERSDIRDNLGECASCHDFGDGVSRKKGFAAVASKARRHAVELKQLTHSAKALDLINTIASGFDEWQTMFDAYVELAIQGKFPEAHSTIIGNMEPLLKRLSEAADALSAEQKNPPQISPPRVRVARCFC